MDWIPGISASAYGLNAKIPRMTIMNSTKIMSKDEKKHEHLEEEIAKLKEQSQEYLSGWQRARADYSNFQKEVEKRQKEMIEFANAATVAEVLPIYNHLKLALKHVPEGQGESDFVKGIEQIRKQFMEFLKKFGIEEIRTVGEQFDPSLHEAVDCQEKDGCKEGMIYEEVSAGYVMGDKVLEPAKVKVGK